MELRKASYLSPGEAGKRGFEDWVGSRTFREDFAEYETDQENDRA